jgi:serine/threonine protein kinase
MPGRVKAKLEYAAPEQLGGGPIDARTDVFGLGLTLHEIIWVRLLWPDGHDALLSGLFA